MKTESAEIETFIEQAFAYLHSVTANPSAYIRAERFLDHALKHLQQLLAEQKSREGARTSAKWTRPAMVPWPVDEPPQYNGRGEPCDMWRGPCSCGGWHDGKRAQPIAPLALTANEREALRFAVHVVVIHHEGNELAEPALAVLSKLIGDGK